MQLPDRARLAAIATVLATLAVSTGIAAAPGLAASSAPYIASSVPVADGCITLGRAWSGNKVFLVQRRLGTRYEKDRYLQGTYDAVARFQLRHALDVTGRVDRLTWAALGIDRPFCMDRFTVQPTLGLKASNHRRVEAMIRWARSQIGRRYIWGGAGPIGYDCSGLALQAMYSAGRVLPTVTTKLHQRQDFPTASAIFDSGLKRVPLPERRRGDLVFYGPAGSISHMAIYLGHDRIIEAVRPTIRKSGLWGHDVPIKPRVVRPFGR